MTQFPVEMVNITNEGMLPEFWPNPVSEKLHWNHLPVGTQITLMDETGKVLQNWWAKDTNDSLNLSSYPPGIYLIRLVHEQRSLEKVEKVVKR